MPYRTQESHKGTFGRIINFSGSGNYVGAAYLSSLSALNVGAGYLALAASKDITDKVSTMLPEAVYLSYQKALNKIKDFSVILFGCGISTNSNAYKTFRKVLSSAIKANTPLILDADGLNLLAKRKLDLPAQTIITPHPKEASKLLEIPIDMVLKDLEASAKMLSEKYNCVTVLKSHRTVICNNNLEIFINQNGNSALAKAGTGDVLAGIIAGLVAQQMSLFDAAKLGVYLHARTGEILSKEYSEYSVLASYIAKNIHLSILELI